ncbi:hypothetical protein [Streptosporangium pseudovulgare]|uniref:DUF2637 domain-containing protein n=1 Tax=Streptosporangium pseudovulgare TaxID=35765 RepID=A0ABQ2QV05_9ACTN|nr:hypothetical protein [Streptosporangium pseudovulgare]GGP97388.1 hypothetical protein GCM10010140_29290 [Streptosporangium pseudovulgare]
MNETTATSPVPPRHPSAVPTRPRTKAQRLAAAARSAADVRAYQVDPDVVALRIERMRAWVDRLIWTGMILGLAFTAVNVQQFAAGDAERYSLAWWSAWLLDPLVSLILIGALIGEQVISRHQLRAGPWVRALKWVALTATYTMNTWEAWAALSPALILLHSVPPIMVFVAAEAVSDLRYWITEAVNVAYRVTAEHALSVQAEPVHTDLTPVGPVPAVEARTDAEGGARTEPKEAPRTDAEDARPVRLEPRTAPALTPTPVDRDAVVADLRNQILAAAGRGEKWTPDYSDLEFRTGRRRSWCEKAVRDARNGVIGADGDRPRTAPVDPADEDVRTETRGDGRTDAETARETVRALRTGREDEHPVRPAPSRTDDGEGDETRTEEAA